MAMTIWGPKASGGAYAAISALTNTPATILAFAVYDFLLGSSTRGTFQLLLKFSGVSVTPPSTPFVIVITSHHAEVYRARAQCHTENDPPLQNPDRTANVARAKSVGRTTTDMTSTEGPTLREHDSRKPPFSARSYPISCSSHSTSEVQPYFHTDGPVF